MSSSSFQQHSSSSGARFFAFTTVLSGATAKQNTVPHVLVRVPLHNVGSSLCCVGFLVVVEACRFVEPFMFPYGFVRTQLGFRFLGRVWTVRLTFLQSEAGNPGGEVLLCCPTPLLLPGRRGRHNCARWPPGGEQVVVRERAFWGVCFPRSGERGGTGGRAVWGTVRSFPLRQQKAGGRHGRSALGLVDASVRCGAGKSKEERLKSVVKERRKMKGNFFRGEGKV